MTMALTRVVKLGRKKGADPGDTGERGVRATSRLLDHCDGVPGAL